MNPEILKKAQEWTTEEYDTSTRQEIQKLIDSDNEMELTDRFWQDLEFGTGGLRGTRGAGTNRMNIYNIRKVTQGLANYILGQGGAKKGVVIGRDSRIYSLEFAQEAASVLVENNITVYFFKDLAPTPVISYAIRELGAKAGIMNTASHNPKEYNGYKVFWEDGAQLTPPHDKNVIVEVRKIDELSKVRSVPFKVTEKSPLFHYCDEYLDSYVQEAKGFAINQKLCKETDLKILYSPLHGCGYKITPKLLKKIGFKNVTLFADQGTPDGNFTNAPSPNPEEHKAMLPGMEYAKANNMDIFIATDPDADRIGVAYKHSNGNFELLNGNQIGILIEYYLLKNKPLENSFLVSTIVSTPLIGQIAAENEVAYSEVLTGFKWIAIEIEKNITAGKNFLFGMEESHGYNISDKVRDKDGVSATAIFAELAAYYKKEGKTLDQVILDIAIKYGHYKESQHSVTLLGKDGVDKINEIMDNLRKNPPKKIGMIELLKTVDYQNDTTGLPPSNVLTLHYEDNIRIIARPSGTEPKLKFYFSTHGEVACIHCVIEVEKDHEEIKKTFLQILNI